MALTQFTIHATAGETTVTVDGTTVAAGRVVFEADNTIPTVTIWTAGDATVTGEGVVQFVRDPTQDEIDAAAVAVLGRVDVGELERRATAKVRGGRQDVYRVVLETLREMADG